MPSRYLQLALLAVVAVHALAFELQDLDNGHHALGDSEYFAGACPQLSTRRPQCLTGGVPFGRQWELRGVFGHAPAGRTAEVHQDQQEGVRKGLR